MIKPVKNTTTAAVILIAATATIVLSMPSMIRSTEAFAPSIASSTIASITNRRGGPVLLSPQPSDDDGGPTNNDGEENLSGSFFNRVPIEPDGETTAGPPPATETESGGGDPFEENLSELLRRRKSKPLAGTPSTVGGVPTARSTGFGKPPSNESTSATAPKIITNRSPTAPIIDITTNTPPPPQPPQKINDVNNPQTDDQGYTLYQNPTTGQKSRVFEALVSYPTEFTLKIVGANEGNFAREMVRLVAENCGITEEREVGRVKFSEKVKGRWTSVTVEAPVESAEMLYALYEAIDRDPRVKFKF